MAGAGLEKTGNSKRYRPRGPVASVFAGSAGVCFWRSFLRKQESSAFRTPMPQARHWIPAFSGMTSQGTPVHGASRMARSGSPNFRTEHDSMGELRVPADALWGAQTQRAVQNFPISGVPMPRGF